MADDKELKDQRVVTMMSPSELDAIDDWMFKNRIRSRGEAIRRLCQIGLLVSQKSHVMANAPMGLLRATSALDSELKSMISTNALTVARRTIAELSIKLAGLLVPTGYAIQSLAAGKSIDEAIRSARRDLSMFDGVELLIDRFERENLAKPEHGADE